MLYGSFNFFAFGSGGILADHWSTVSSYYHHYFDFDFAYPTMVYKYRRLKKPALNIAYIDFIFGNKGLFILMNELIVFK